MAKALRDLSLGEQDMTPLMRALAETLKTDTDLNFEDEGHPAWQPSVAALARKGMTTVSRRPATRQCHHRLQ
ncbi:MAG: phage virion morphogenesis protein [Sodalis sp. (in: enterobacteria)]|uniref:phage virion morphogenesis protein n=1 Tax=Sodalis sp. (in: enterobacteria) TaxID=1898979 RepID=UPI003F3857D2